MVRRLVYFLLGQKNVNPSIGTVLGGLITYLRSARTPAGTTQRAPGRVRMEKEKGAELEK